jgi:nicotinamidase-related amidase
VAEIARRIPERPDKVAFSSCAVPSITKNFRSAGRPKILLAGIEAHVCVQGTAFDLLAMGFRVYVAADAVGSRYAIDRQYALRRLEQAGAIITTSEAAVFEWIGGAGVPQFKEISRLVQERMKALPGEGHTC